MKKRITRIIITIIIFSFIVSGIAYAETPAATSEVKDIEYLQSVMDMIKEKYKGEITEEKLIEGALKGMFNTMDPYTTYFTPEENESFLSQLNGTYRGIGIMIEKQGDYVVIIKVFPSTPAEMAGILPGDKFLKVGDKDMVGASTDEVSSLVKGNVGTQVKLQLLRSGHKDPVVMQVPRAEINITPGSYEIRGDIGYIKLDSFGDYSYKHISDSLAIMDQKNIKKIILDLRDNGGGYVDQAVGIAQYFVPRGLITKLDFKSVDLQDQEYKSFLDHPKYKLAVLVNGRSASASEILAGAIQDTKGGTLIGTKTFGKAKVQNVLPILKPEAYLKYSNQLGVKIIDASDLMSKYNITPLDSEIEGYTKITVGTYTTPKGRMIDLVGLTPDIKVADPKVTKGLDIGNIQKLKKTTNLKLNNESVDVYNAEKILLLSGYNVGTPDVKLDSKTVAAIKSFQKANRKAATGILDAATQELLNKKLDKLILSMDLQYAKAVEILKK